LILDPFAGSGSTLIAAHLEGFNSVGIELDAEYARIAEARLAWWQAQPQQTTL
jgi:site-specific DNA-methyltransferase (adenine-specific)